MNRQQMVLEFIAESSKKNGYPPSIREIAAGVGLRSSSTVFGHLEQLKEKGKITWEPHEFRTLRLMDVAEYNESPVVLKRKCGIPTVIEWQGRRYNIDPG